MLRIFSLMLVLGGCAAALVTAGQFAFGNEAVLAADGVLYGFFKALPGDTAYAAPLVGVAVVAFGYFILRLLGMIVSVAGGVLIVGMIVTVFFKPEWLAAIRQLTGT